MRIKQKLSIEEVLEIVPKEPIKGHTLTFAGESVPSDTDNLILYKNKGITCQGCGIVGTHFYVEKFGYGNKTYNFWHLNLYAKKSSGKEVLMTKDHIVPKCHGGKNDLENYQVMCERCNTKKGQKGMQEFLNNRQKSQVKTPSVDIETSYKQRTLSRLKERYGIEINHDTLDNLTELVLSGQILCDLSSNKSIRAFQYANKIVNAVYNSEYKIIETVIEEDYEKVKFEYLPVFMTKEFAEREYNEIYQNVQREFIIKESEKETAIEFQKSEYRSILFAMWKGKNYSRLIWSKVKEKFNNIHKECTQSTHTS